MHRRALDGCPGGLLPPAADVGAWPPRCRYRCCLLSSADAKNLRSQGKLKLGHLMSEFKLAGKAMAATHAGKETAGAVFFALVEFTAAKELFGK